MNKYQEALRLLKDYYQTPESWKDYQTLKELVDKTQSKKPVKSSPGSRWYVCPECKGELLYMNNKHYCGHCGQHLDWSDLYMEKNKYQDALDLIRNDCNGGRPKLTQIKGNELLDTLQELIDDYYFMHKDDMKLALEGMNELNKYKKALDTACDIISHERLSFSSYHDTKEDWKEYLLSEASK